MTGEVKKEAEALLDGPGTVRKKGPVATAGAYDTATNLVHKGGTGVAIFTLHALLAYIKQPWIDGLHCVPAVAGDAACSCPWRPVPSLNISLM